MNAPAYFGVKRKVTDSPLATDRKATFGSICAAWKSIECGMSASFVRVNSTVSPTLVCTMGPGTSPSKVHAATTVSSEMRMGASRACQCSCSNPPGASGGSSGANRWYAVLCAPCVAVPVAEVLPCGLPLSTAESSRLSELCGWLTPCAAPPVCPACGAACVVSVRFGGAGGEQAVSAAPTPGIASVSAEARARNARRSCSSDPNRLSVSDVRQQVREARRPIHDVLVRRVVAPVVVIDDAPCVERGVSVGLQQPDPF